MRTNWGARTNKDTPELSPDYEPSVGAPVKALRSYRGQETIDPAKVGELILRLASSESLPAHLLLGRDAVQYAGQTEATRAADAERWQEVNVSTCVNAPGALPLRLCAHPHEFDEKRTASLTGAEYLIP